MEYASGFIDITPTTKACLGGWSKRSGPSSRVASNIEANILILRESQTLVFISIDALYAGETLTSALVSIMEKHELGEKDLVVAASHTHFAPMLDLGKPNIGVVDAEHLTSVIKKVGALLNTLLSGLFKSAIILYSKENDFVSINRRKCSWNIGRRGLRFTAKMIPNPKATESEAMHVFTIGSTSGEIFAVIWSLACHPVGWPDKNEISSEFPGVVRENLRSNFGLKLPVIFLQGFSADLRPWTKPVSPKFSFKNWWRSQHFLHPNKIIYKNWVDQISIIIRKKVAGFPLSGETIEGDLKSTLVKIPLTYFFKGVKPNNQLTLKVYLLGSRHVIVGANCEVPVDIRKIIEFECKELRTIPISCIDDSFGYFPSTRMLSESGYEVDGWLRSFGLPWKTLRGTDPDSMIRESFRSIFNRFV